MKIIKKKNYLTFFEIYINNNNIFKKILNGFYIYNYIIYLFIYLFIYFY